MALRSSRSSKDYEDSRDKEQRDQSKLNYAHLTGAKRTDAFTSVQARPSFDTFADQLRVKILSGNRQDLYCLVHNALRWRVSLQMLTIHGQGE